MNRKTRFMLLNVAAEDRAYYLEETNAGKVKLRREAHQRTHPQQKFTPYGGMLDRLTDLREDRA